MIPVLDWHRFISGSDATGFVRDLGHACRDTGFFLLANHGIAPQLIDAVFAQGMAFFALPDAEKRKLDIRRNPHNRGWAAQGSEALDDTSGQMDRKEAFNIGFDLPQDDPRVAMNLPFRGVNIWPDGLPGFRPAMLRYYDEALSLGRDLMRAVATDLSLCADHFDGDFPEPMATLRILSYPAGTG
ncbi:isopenicillin N synthase family oxygenase, partial [Thioclava sp. BHET1]